MSQGMLAVLMFFVIASIAARPQFMTSESFEDEIEGRHFHRHHFRPYNHRQPFVGNFGPSGGGMMPFGAGNFGPSQFNFLKKGISLKHVFFFTFLICSYRRRKFCNWSWIGKLGIRWKFRNWIWIC